VLRCAGEGGGGGGDSLQHALARKMSKLRPNVTSHLQQFSKEKKEPEGENPRVNQI